MNQYQKSLFIFRRDLRLEDNTGLIAAFKSSEVVIPCFIFDPRQVEKNPYRGDHAVQFMIESLQDLEVQLKGRGGRLFLFYGAAHEVVERLIIEEKIDAVFVNRDYTPFSIKRDLAIEKVCRAKGAAFLSSGDSLLNEPEAIRKNDGGIYTIYTPFAFKAMQTQPAKPSGCRLKNFFTGKVPFEAKGVYEKVLKGANPSLAVKGGREEALKILRKIKRFADYDSQRNIPSIDGTTMLSAHNKFGTCSVREVYDAVFKSFGPSHTLIRELYWRDFFTHIGFHFPHVLGNAFHKKYDKLQWENDKGKFNAWRRGETGFPIIDAGMRQLNATGFMHNRVRMVVASFLVKDLHIDWRWGEKYFAQKLVDYDPLVNNGNWQWAASTGCDAQPYFRIFNPWLQQERFDPDCRYIQQWIPELKGLKPKAVHSLSKESSPSLFRGKYPAPIVDHKMESQRALAQYRI